MGINSFLPSKAAGLFELSLPLLSFQGAADNVLTIRSLVPDTMYKVRIVAVNGDGSSPPSDSIDVLTLPLGMAAHLHHLVFIQ